MTEGSLESNFRQYGQMEKQRWEESEKRKSQQKGRSEKRKSQKKEDKVGSLKRRVRSHLGRWEMKNCTPLWRKEHFEVKTSRPEYFWMLTCRKSARRCGAKHMSKSKYTKHHSRSTFGSWDVQKVHAIVARSTFEVKSVKNWRSRTTFWGCGFAWQAQGIQHLAKSEQNVRVLWQFQKRWQAWGVWGRSAKYFAWQAQYKRHVHQRCKEVRALISWQGLRFGASDHQVCWDDFAW